MTLIELKEVSKTFGEGNREVTALQKTNFSVEEGEFAAIIGSQWFR